MRSSSPNSSTVGAASRSVTRSLTRSVTVAGVALLAAAAITTPAAAQGRWGRGGYGTDNGGGYDNRGGYGRTASGGRPLYTWNGRVDREAYIVMQNGDVRTQIDGSDNGAGGRVRVASALPQTDGILDVQLQEGRGRVDVVEQPTGRNGYRAVVRVRDDDAGAGYYRLVATWRPTGGGGYANGGYDDGYGRGRGRDDDGRNGNNGTYGNNGSYGNNGGYGNTGSYGGSGVLHWRGRVDDVEDIRIQGSRVDARTVRGAGAAGVRTEFSGGALPARDVAVRVNGRSGRGRVTIVQQPHAWNGYTAIVRVEDLDPGASWYDFDVSW